MTTGPSKYSNMSDLSVGDPLVGLTRFPGAKARTISWRTQDKRLTPVKTKALFFPDRPDNGQHQAPSHLGVFTTVLNRDVKGIVHQKMKFPSLSTHHYATGGMGEVFEFTLLLYFTYFFSFYFTSKEEVLYSPILLDLASITTFTWWHKPDFGWSPVSLSMGG